MRIIGHLVIKDEADRYLERVLRWHSDVCDELFVYDDGSTDDSVAVASQYATVVSAGSSQFMSHEGACRQAAWDSMAAVMRPSAGSDWILCLDADEFTVSKSETKREGLERLADGAGTANSVDLRIDEIFDVVAGVPMRRLDGFWGGIHAPRFVRFLEGGRFTHKEMGGGSIPAYGTPGLDATGDTLGILHYGYATAADRVAKHGRYSSKTNNGHNKAHVASILTAPTLRSVKGVAP